jgi:hypothetical protein
VLFGAGYVAYMTFNVALLAGQGLADGSKALFFVILGVASAVTMAVWGRVMALFKGGWGPTVVSVIVMVGVLPLLLWHGLAAAITSGIIFGGSFMAGPAAATVIAPRSLTLGLWLSVALLAVSALVAPLQRDHLPANDTSRA